MTERVNAAQTAVNALTQQLHYGMRLMFTQKHSEYEMSDKMKQMDT